MHVPILALLAACSAGGASIVDPPSSAPVAHVVVTFPTNPLLVGQAEIATARLTDSKGNILLNRTVTWLSSEGTVASISAGGTISALVPGMTAIRASVEGKTGSAGLSVIPPAVHAPQ